MVNIEQITSTLAKLPDQALQRYAMMHKDDPYIMSLAVSESKRRKEMRSAGQAQGMQPQPKVVDQAVAAMGQQPAQAISGMPEEQGIGALPAAQQMNFADGGITGYAPGGVTREDVDKAYKDWMSAQPSWFQQTSPMSSQRLADAEARYNDLLRQYQTTQGQAAPAAAMTAPAPVEKAQYNPADATRRSQYDQTLPGQTQASPGPSTQRAQLAPAAGSGVSSGAGAARAPAAPAASIEDRFLAAQKKMTEQPNPFAVQESAVDAETRKLAEEKFAGVKADQEKFKDAFKGREARLEERAQELAKSKDTNTGLAFLEAGLAMMSTPGGLATAIGKGAREGTAKYAAGIDKLHSAQDKLDEAKDRVEELKLNRAEMSSKELREAEMGIQQAVLSGKKDALASAKALYGKNADLAKEVAKTTIDVEQKALDRASHERTAGAAAALALKPQTDFINDWLKKPENAGKTYSDAYAALKSLGAASERNDITGLKTVQAGLMKEIADNLGMDKATKAAKQAQIDSINKQILALSGVGAGASTQGGAQRTIDWNSIK